MIERVHWNNSILLRAASNFRLQFLLSTKHPRSVLHHSVTGLKTFVTQQSVHQTISHSPLAEWSLSKTCSLQLSSCAAAAVLQCCSGARYKLCWVGYLGINHNPSIPTLSRAANMKYITARGVQSRGWLQFIVQNVSKRCLVQGRTPRPPLSYIQPLTLPRRPHSCCLHNSASKRSIRRFVITEKALLLDESCYYRFHI